MLYCSFCGMAFLGHAVFDLPQKKRTHNKNGTKLVVPLYMKAKGGENMTIDEYIQLYGPRLYGLCLTLCRSEPEAEDLYQETWLRVVEQFHRYDPAREFEPWLTRICVNLYRNLLRRLVRSPIRQSFSSTEEKEALLNSAASPPVPAREDYAELHSAIARLPEKLRVAVILFYFRDMDIHSAASILGVAPGTMKSRLNRARARLKEALPNETDLSL